MCLAWPVWVDHPNLLRGLTGTAEMLYEQIINTYGNEAQMWGSVMKAASSSPTAKRPTRARVPASLAKVPICPLH